MMMMSSNTVGNNDFNTAGVTPFDAKKTKAKKETELKLTKARPDSFERANPRDNTPEAPPTAETPAKTGGSSVIAIGLSAVSLIGAGIAGWFAVSKGGEAEAAKKLATSLETKVKDLETKVVGVSEQKVQELIDTALTGKLDADGVKALFATVLQNHPNKTEITADIAAAVADKANTTAIDALAQKLESAKLTKTQEENVKELLRIFVAGQLSKPQLAEVNDLIRQATQGDISIAEFYNLESLVGEHTEKFRTLLQEVGGKTVSNPDIFNLFKTPPTLAKDTEVGFKSAVRAYLNDVEGTADSHSITLIKAGLDAIENPGDLLRLKADLPSTLDKNNEVDLYHSQLRNLTNSLDLIETIFNGEDVELAYTKRTPKEILDVITTKAQAVVQAAHAENLEDVKTAQTELVAELQQQFGRSRTQKFEADYGETAVKTFTAPTDPKKGHGWVLDFFNPQKSFDDMAKVITEAGQGLDGTQTNNTHKDPHTLATVVLPNVIRALTEAYPDSITKDELGFPLFSSNNMELRNVIDTLNKLKETFQPLEEGILEQADRYPFVEVSAEVLEKLHGINKLQAKFINARLKGKNPEGQAEMANVTEQMNNLLRTQLKALNEAETLVKIPRSVVESLDKGSRGSISIGRIKTFGEFVFAKRGIIPDDYQKLPISSDIADSVKSALGVTDLSQQEKIGRIINAVFSLKNGESIDPLLEDLTNKPAIVAHVKSTINKLSDRDYKLEDVTTIITGLGQLIKEGLPATTAE